jgi:hypothetical protein
VRTILLPLLFILFSPVAYLENQARIRRAKAQTCKNK